MTRFSSRDGERVPCLNLPQTDVRHRRRILARHVYLAGGSLVEGWQSELVTRLEEFILSPQTQRAKVIAARIRLRRRQRRARRQTRLHLK